MKLFQVFTGPPGLDPVQRDNFINVGIDAIGVGLASSAGPFLPVFLTRLGASSLQVGLLTAMPALTGLLLAIPMGRYLQRQTRIVPWFSISRLGVILGYALSGLIGFFVHDRALITGILAVWAMVTIPQTMLSITFSVVMNAVAGPNMRFELMTRRWSILGVTTAITVYIIGQVLKRIAFPLNYQVVFLFLSLGGLVSFYFSNRIKIQELAAPVALGRQRLRDAVRSYIDPIRAEKPFLSFIGKRFIYLTGVSLAIPLFPLYFVRAAQLDDATIANINLAQTAIMILGYTIWTQTSRKRGSRQVLLWSTLGLSIYPIAIASSHNPLFIVLFAGASGVFQAGVDLVFFDELMKKVPLEYSATFVSFAQSLQYFSSFTAPLVGTLIADRFGIGYGLIIAGIFRLIGFVLFAAGGQFLLRRTAKEPAA